MTDDTALAVSPSVPLPIYGGAAMAQALTAYRELQLALDRSMPDQIIEIQGRQFRKKGYWRAIAVAFNLSVELINERREIRGAFEDGSENFGYYVVCRATMPNGRTAIGDGSVFAIEKARRDVADKWAALPPQASEHNVRSHAVTRATNRAISNLVGFGEVSAEEADQEDAAPPSPAVADDGPLRVRRVEIKSGATNGKPWSLYLVTFSDGRSASTFKAEIGALAQRCHTDQIGVHAVLVKGKKPGHLDLEELTAIPTDPDQAF